MPKGAWKPGFNARAGEISTDRGDQSGWQIGTLRIAHQILTIGRDIAVPPLYRSSLDERMTFSYAA